MKSQSARIGLTFRFANSLGAYEDAIQRAGGTVVRLAPDSAPRLDGLDGLILGGGRDIDPKWYGEERSAETQEPDPERDEFELNLARLAMESKLPVLAICRGMQLVNVLLGGKLHQDLADRRPLHDQRTDLVAAVHRITLTESSMLAGIAGGAGMSVNSRHHQALSDLGSGLQAAATAPDGIVEAIEIETHSNFLGIQWHPEDRAATSLPDQALFDWLVQRSLTTMT